MWKTSVANTIPIATVIYVKYPPIKQNRSKKYPKWFTKFTTGTRSVLILKNTIRPRRTLYLYYTTDFIKNQF